METLPNSGEPRDGQSARSAAKRLPEPFTGCKTFGEMLRRLELGAVERTRKTLPPDLHKAFWPSILRRLEEWPDWVLRIAAEVWHVHFPTIQKETILDAFRCLNFFMFVARIDGAPQSASRPKFPDLSPKILGAMVGHGVAMNLTLQALVEEAKDILPPEKLAEYSKHASTEELQSKIAPHIGEYFKLKPSGFLEFQEGFSQAKGKTFDKNGSLKATPLTPVYEKILADWPEIEGLSGPKALTEYLSPLLGKQDFEEKYDRVKMICSRFQIKFLPSVK